MEVVIFVVLRVWLSLENCKKTQGLLANGHIQHYLTLIQLKVCAQTPVPDLIRTNPTGSTPETKIKCHQLRTFDTPMFLTDSYINCEKEKNWFI